MDKIKLLLVPSDLAGVGHFRSIWPAQQIQKDYPGEFDIEINNSPNTNNIEYLANFDIIHFHRHLGNHEQMPELFKMLRERGTILIMDIDDYWDPPKTHPLYGAAQKEGLSKKITETLKTSDYITTTTEIFADYIKPYNKNVKILFNAIDTNHRMWQDEEVVKTDKCRIAWIGGSSHNNDLEVLKSSMNMLHSDTELKEKYQIVMCGYDIRGSITEISPDGKSSRTRKIKPEETIWNKFEETFTNNYQCVNENYKKWLKKCKNEPYPFGNLYDQTYVRRWTLPLTQYGRHYNYCDVCLAPLAENIFNATKSELKIIESGMKKKVLIAQDFAVYKALLKDGENGLLVPTKKNIGGWYKAMKKVINDKELREKLSTNLYNMVKDKYNLKNATKERVEFYKKLIATKQKKVENLSTSK